MTIPSLKSIEKPDIDPLMHISEEDGDYAAYHREYDNCELLSEVREMSSILLRRPRGVRKYDWYIVNIFGYQYTHGFLFHLPDCGKFSFDTLKEDLYNHYFVRKPRQDELLEPMWDRYMNEEIIASILAFGIDPVKFWFALLWLMNFIDDKLENNREKYRDAIECIDDFIRIVKEETHYIDKEGNFRILHRPELTLRLEVKGKTELRIENPSALCLIEELLVEHREELVEKNNRGLLYLFDGEGPIHSNKNENIYLFRKYMTTYLKAHKAVSGKCISDFILDGSRNKDASVHKDYLIYRLMLVIGYLPDITPKTRDFKPRDEKSYLKELLHNSHLEYSDKKVSYTYQDFADSDYDDETLGGNP